MKVVIYKCGTKIQYYDLKDKSFYWDGDYTVNLNGEHNLYSNANTIDCAALKLHYNNLVSTKLISCLYEIVPYPEMVSLYDHQTL